MRTETIFLIIGVVAIFLFGIFFQKSYGIFSIVGDSQLNTCQLLNKYENLSLDCTPKGSGYGAYVYCDANAWTWIKFKWVSESAYIDSISNPVYSVTSPSNFDLTMTDLTTGAATNLGKYNFVNSFNVNLNNPYLLTRNRYYELKLSNIVCEQGSLTFRFNPATSQAAEIQYKEYRGTGTTYGAGNGYALLKFNILNQTIPVPICNTPADIDCNNIVSRGELGNYITKWINNQVTRDELALAIQAWIGG